MSQFLSTLPARGATALGLNFGPCFRQFLSTLPARGATGRRAGLLPAPPISIHAPREGSDGCSRLLLPRPTDFYPRSPRGERPGRPPSAPGCRRFLSTLPARGATWISVKSLKAWPFLSTLPARGATRRAAAHEEDFQFLSTLPARGATRRPDDQTGVRDNFYPRSPRGERPRAPCGARLDKGFLSTLPARGATGCSLP